MAWYLILHSLEGKTLPAARDAAKRAKEQLEAEEKR